MEENQKKDISCNVEVNGNNKNVSCKVEVNGNKNKITIKGNAPEVKVNVSGIDNTIIDSKE